MATESSAAAGPGASDVPAFSWQYLGNSTTMLGVVLAVSVGLVESYFYGPWPAALWTVCAVSMLLALVVFSVRANLGDAAADLPAVSLHAALVSLWMAGAAALWLTGNPSAWVIAVVIPASWSMHIIFGSRGKLNVTLALLSLCALPLLGFLLHAAWVEYPVWLIIAAMVSAVCTVMSIAASADYSHRNFMALQKAMAETSAIKSRLEFAIDAVGDGYFELNLENMAYDPNHRLAKKLGYGSTSADAAVIAERIHSDDIALVQAQIDMARQGISDGFNADVRVRTADGEHRWMNARARVLNAPGEPRKLIGTLVDLTDRKALEEELRAAKEAAEASSHAKSQFLANMSHEIRTPLNGVLGMAQALETDDLSAAQREKVAVILDSGKSLTALLNDVLDLTRIEAGKLEISAVPGDFLHTMKRTRQLFQATADDKGLDLFVRYDSGFPQRICYDPVRVRQCVSNLLSNAIKFTAQGRVEVAISAKPIADGVYRVAVEVSDTGIGMSSDTVGKLFSAFTQADGATTRKFGGSGLGLAISRQLARMMGGDLTVESAEGQGSTFRLTFKAQEAAATAAGPGQTQPAKAEPLRRSLRGMRVLLTDDNAINRQVIKLFLAPQGCDIVEATNGKEALDKVASQQFDLVLLDVHMPVMDGKEAIQRLRASEKWKSLPVIALTADAMSGDREKYLALGMSDYVSKPVDQRELIARMYSVLKLEAPAAAAKTGT